MRIILIIFLWTSRSIKLLLPYACYPFSLLMSQKWSIKGAETDQEAGGLIRPYIRARIPNVRMQNKECEFKCAL